MPEQPSAEELLRTREAREELTSGAPGEHFSAQGLSVRVANLPLFVRSDDGGLRQTVRVSVEADSDVGSVAFSLFSQDTLLDQRQVPVAEGKSVVDLTVPEVQETRPVTLQLSRGSSKPFRRAVKVHPQRKWSVFVVHHSHLDIGYTDPQNAVLQHQMQYLDSVLDLVSATDGWPEASRFRWNVEANWPLRYWLKARPAQDRKKFFRRVHEGRIEVCALPFSMHTEAYSIDELSRQLTLADELREEYGLPITTAMQTDVPGATKGFLGLLVDAGVRYLAVAHNYAGRSVPHLAGGQELSRPFYWQAPNGKRLLVWYTDTPHGSAYMEGNFLGLAESYDTAVHVLPGYLKALAEGPYPYSKQAFWAGVGPGVEMTKLPYPHDVLHLRVNGAIADNAPPSIVPAEIVREWNERWVYPRLRLATNGEFFSTAEGRLKERLETYSGDWTDWWVDGIGSGARHLGFNRRAQAQVRTAQTLHKVADVLSHEDATPGSEIEAAYDNMALFDEHTWGASNPWDDELEKTESGVLQWEKKAAFAREAYDGAQGLVNSGIHRLSRAFAGASNSLGAITVFNPSRWERTDLVRVFVPRSRVDARQALSLVDASTQKEIPYVLEEQEHARHRARGCYVSFIAHNVPPNGYVRYELYEGDSEVPSGSGVREESLLENEHYRVRFDAGRGTVSQLLDKGTGRDLVNGEALFGFNQYVYDRYTSAPHFNHLSSRIQATDLSLLGERSVAQYGTVVGRSSNAVWDRVNMRMGGGGAEFVETTLTLLRGVKRLDIRNRVGKIGTPQKESVYFAFPFNAKDPSVTYEITGAIDSPGAPRIPGSANHMRAIRHWVGLEEGPASFAWAAMEAPLVQLGNIHLPYAPFPKTLDADSSDSATIYSWALNNIWDTNFPPQQQGEMKFHYSVASGDEIGTTELGMRTAASLAAPLLGILSKPVVGADLPARGSFCRVDHPDIDIVALASSRREHDLVVFLQSYASSTVDARVSFPMFSLKRAWTGSFLERNLEEVEVDGEEVELAIPAGSYVALAVDLHGTGY